MHIRHENLYAFWSGSPATVAQNKYRVRRSIKDLNEELGITDAPFYDNGPYPNYDSEGYTVAYSVLLASKRSGRYEKTYSQWQTIRHVKGAIGNYERTSSGGFALVDDENGLSQHFQDGGSSSKWYRRFAAGCKARMGSVVKKNLALGIKLILKVLDKIDEKMAFEDENNNSTERDRWVIAGAYIAISFVLSLRGNEGFMMDIKELMKNQSLEKGLVWIILSGIIKGESTPMLHQLRSVPVTSSGINIELWRDRLIAVHTEAGRTEGPAICDTDGYLMSNTAANELFWTALEEVYWEAPDSFPKDIRSVKDIKTHINIYRSLRRSSNSRAISEGVMKTDIDIVERWRNEQASKGQAPSEAMHIGYADQELLNKCFERYTRSM